MIGTASEARARTGGLLLTFRINTGLTSLYDIGYLSIDLYHLIVVSELIHKNRFDVIMSTFTRAPIFALPNRHTQLFRDFRPCARIVNARAGSFEILVEGLSLVALIVVPFLGIYVQREIARRDRRIIFQFDVNDPEITALLNEVAAGKYGRSFDDWFDFLCKVLAIRGYDISANDENIFVIRRLLKAYSRRMIRTIPEYIS